MTEQWTTLPYPDIATPDGEPLETNGTLIRTITGEVFPRLDRTYKPNTIFITLDGKEAVLSIPEIIERFTKQHRVRQRGRPSSISADVLTHAKKLAANGLTLRQIAAQLGVTKDALHRAGLKTATSKAKPDRRVKITKREEEQIQALKGFGVNVSQSAKDLGVSRSTIRRHS